MSPRHSGDRHSGDPRPGHHPPSTQRLPGTHSPAARGPDCRLPSTHPPTAPRPGDRGSATVWTVATLAVLCVVFGVVLALGQAVVTRHRAAGGADLAALAAADHWVEGAGAACERAERVARAQGTRLVRCALVGDVSDVSAAAGRGPFAVEVRARAGPPSPPGTPSPAPPAGVP
ncbi:Rv3654c family TadE-like protein [Streptomyces sp. YS415]|uniref:Rv3654c family TadE-like protein n=1 Tax=Streptomyces sp. YS415 TaxID=2944806 RepID=UPI0035ABA3FC